MTAMFFEGLSRGIVPTSVNGTPFPTNNSMFMVPGEYQWRGQNYDCTAPGRYLFEDANFQTEQRCVIIGGDALDACKALDWAHVHGAAHNSITGNALSITGRWQRLILGCGYLTDFIVWLLPQVGLEARRVDVATNEPPNGVDDGHIVTEVKFDGRWVLVDVTTGYYFTDANGDILSVVDFIEAIKGDFPTMNRLSGAYKTNAELAHGVDYSFYRDIRLTTQDELQAWYRRLYQRIV